MANDADLCTYLDALDAHHLVALAVQDAQTSGTLPPLEDYGHLQLIREALVLRYGTLDNLKRELTGQVERQAQALIQSEPEAQQEQERETQRKQRLLDYLNAQPTLVHRHYPQRTLQVSQAQLNAKGEVIFLSTACPHWYSYYEYASCWLVSYHSGARCDQCEDFSVHIPQ